MADQLDAIGLPWSFFDACTSAPDGLPYDEEVTRRMHGRTLTRGEVGCFASHWTLWRSMLEPGGPEMLVVLEDDVLLNPVFFADLKKVAEAARPFGYLRLYAKVPAGLRREAGFLDRHIARFSGRAYGTQAYILSRQAAKRWLSSIKQIERPVDDEMDRYWAHGVPIRAVFPFPVMEVDYGSTIEGRRREVVPLPLPQRVRLSGLKAWEKARRHAHDLRARLPLGG
jgi:glycosyl transferase family 25